MTPEGYSPYERRSYCKSVACPVQIELETFEPGSEPYERVRRRCRTACIHTTWEFHRWLTDEGYIIVKRD
jgi:hypothetical protein